MQQPAWSGSTKQLIDTGCPLTSGASGDTALHTPRLYSPQSHFWKRLSSNTWLHLIENHVQSIIHQKVPYVTRTMYVYTVTRKNLVRISPHLCYTPKTIVQTSYYTVTSLCNTHDIYCMGGCPPVCHIMSVKDIVTRVCMSCGMMPIRVSQLQYIHRNTSVHLLCSDACLCVALTVHTS